MSGLKKLVLIDCQFHQHNSIPLLSHLASLEELSLVHCDNITDQHLLKLQNLQKLVSLTIFNCKKVCTGLIVNITMHNSAIKPTIGLYKQKISLSRLCKYA